MGHCIEVKYLGYPESKFRWAIEKKKQVLISEPLILPFDVPYTTSDIVPTIVEAVFVPLHRRMIPPAMQTTC
jgi:hypothetical protein